MRRCPGSSARYSKEWPGPAGIQADVVVQRVGFEVIEGATFQQAHREQGQPRRQQLGPAARRPRKSGPPQVAAAGIGPQGPAGGQGHNLAAPTRQRRMFRVAPLPLLAPKDLLDHVQRRVPFTRLGITVQTTTCASRNQRNSRAASPGVRSAAGRWLRLCNRAGVASTWLDPHVW